MKKIIIVVVFLFTKITGFAQTPAPNFASTCSCKANQSVCSADALFMSCCTCCTPPASCGSWTAWGLCGCKCETVTNGAVVHSEVKFYLNRYNDFMTYLSQNKVVTDRFQQYFKAAILNKPINKTTNASSDYVVLQGNDLATFTNAYLADMKEISKDPGTAALLDAYLNKK